MCIYSCSGAIVKAMLILIFKIQMQNKQRKMRKRLKRMEKGRHRVRVILSEIE